MSDYGCCVGMRAIILRISLALMCVPLLCLENHQFFFLAKQLSPSGFLDVGLKVEKYVYTRKAMMIFSSYLFDFVKFGF